MTELQHRIKIFVYRIEPVGPRYLLLRRSVGVDPTWGPIHGPIGFGEQIEAAIRREVRDDTGLATALDVIDLRMPAHWLLGDEQIIEWPYGFRTELERRDLVLDPRWSDFTWTEFSDAYARLQLDVDRAAMTRLHTLIAA